MAPRPRPHRERVLAKTAIMPSGCVEWTGARQRGYGVAEQPSGKTGVAHRVVYELLAGPIPEGETLDHLCRNRACVNPGHLEPVSRGENTMRGDTIAAANAAKTHCKRGHGLHGDNLEPYALRRGKRACVTCRRARRNAA